MPLTTSTKAELTLNTSSGQNPIMYVDEDGNGTTDKEVNSYTSPNPTLTPTPTLTPQPTPVPTAILIFQEESAISEENNVLGAKTNSRKEQNVNRKILGTVDKRKNSPLAVLFIVLVGGIAIFYFKFKR